MRHWIKISNMFKGINLMKKNIVKTIRDPNEIVDDINKSPRRKKTLNLNSQASLNFTKTAIDEVRN